MKLIAGIVLIICTLTGVVFARGVTKENWRDKLQDELARLDAETPGELGVYVKGLTDTETLDYKASRGWYLSSTTKVLVGAALLKDVEQGRLDLSDTIVLRKSDFIDGSGPVNKLKPGKALTLAYLLEKMLTQSDSTATDILIRKVGVDRVNAFVHSNADSFGPLTSIVDVRYGAYAEAHDRARTLSNLDFLRFKTLPNSKRLRAFASKVKVRPQDLRVSSVDEAFERFYARGMNTANLVSYGVFLERLFAGEILSPVNTGVITTHMEAARTGEKRIKAGLPPGYKFAQKTGTQIARMCNVGRITPPNGQALIVTACIEKFGDHAKGELIFKKIGEALARSGAFTAI